LEDGRDKYRKTLQNKLERKEKICEEHPPIVTIPLVGRPSIVAVELELVRVGIQVEHIRVTIAVGNLYKIPSVPPPLENSIIISRLNII
jgi:hypothetical protein